MESLRRAGEGGQEPVEPPNKRGRKNQEKPEPREKRERTAKTDALFKMQQQSKSEDAPKKSGKRQDNAGVGAPIRKMHKTETADAKVAPEQGTGSFSTLPGNVVQNILGFLPKKDMQAARVETFMNQQVIRRVKGIDLPLIQRLTEFLSLELGQKFEIPATLEEALATQNLDEYTDALYAVRSWLIDSLATLDTDTLASLEEGYRETTFALPRKFENIFALARLESGVNFTDEGQGISRDIAQLGEWHELARVHFQKKPNPDASEFFLNAGLDEANLFDRNKIDRLRNIDSATFRLITDCCESLPESHTKNDTLMSAYMFSAIDQILKGSYEKSIESVLKLNNCFSGTQENVRSQEFKMHFANAVFCIAIAMVFSEIDDKTAVKIFTPFEQNIPSDICDRMSQYLHLGKLILYAHKGFAELQIAIDKLLDSAENSPFKSWEEKRHVLESITQSIIGYLNVININREIPVNKILHAVTAAKKSDSQIVILRRIYEELKHILAIQIQDPDLRLYYVR